jgi:hypothetical protein
MSFSKRRRYSKARSYARSFRRGGTRRIPSASRRKLRAVANLRTGGTLGIEKKYYDSEQANVTMVATPVTSLVPMDSLTPANPGTAVYYLNSPAVGSASYNRDGRVIRNHSIEVQGRVHVKTSSKAIGNIHSPTICVALVLDTQVNASAPTAATYGGEVYEIFHADDPSQVYRKMSNTTRFRVLAFKKIQCKQDWVQDVSGVANGISAQSAYHFKMYRKLGFKTNYKVAPAGNPTSSDIVDNGIFLMCWMDSVTNISVGAHYTSRLRFTG